MAEAIAPGHMALDERECPLGRGEPTRLLQSYTSICQGGYHQAVPIGEHLVVQAGSHALVARCQQFLPQGSKAGLDILQATMLLPALRIARIADGTIQVLKSVQNIVSLEISIQGYIVVTRKIVGVVRTKDVHDFGTGPDVEFALLTLRISVKRSTKCAFRRGHLAGHPIDGFLGALEKELLPTVSVGEGKQLQELSVVVKHLLEMRNQPFFINGISRKTSAQVVVDSALAHMRKRELYEFKKSRIVFAQTSTPKHLQHRTLRKFRCPAEPAVGLIECACDGGGSRVQLSGTDDNLVGWPGLGRQCVHQGSAVMVDALGFLAKQAGDFPHHVNEARTAIA